MNLNYMLSTKEKIKILKYIIYKTENLRVNITAFELNLSKGLISKFFSILLKEKILKKTNNHLQVENNMGVKAIKILLNLNRLDIKLFKKYDFVKSAGIYGSFVNGKNTEKSDIDMWVILKKANDKKIAKFTSELLKKYNNIKPLYLTEEKLRILKKEDISFYYSLMFGSITIYGEDIETI